MSSVRALPSVRNCSHCHYRTLNAFASFAGLSIRPQPSRLIQSSQSITTSPISQRSFSNISRSQSRWRPIPANNHGEQEVTSEDLEQPSTHSIDESPMTWRPPVILEGKEHVEHSGNTEESLNQQKDDSLPWYLQVQAQESSSPMSRRQEIPKLPDNAPEKLQAILEHLSIDIGLDDLKILDLRRLDPPPALGSNLLMVIGTARSEKHLHVSADRFCRWLRTEYKLRPFADGLLGRNELKLKLKRKARRAKLLGSSSGKGDQDDGIRTDWICVNVGPVEESNVIEEPLEEDGIIGFGGREDGTKLVVQMATESKHEELNLEHLWTGFLRRQEKKNQADLEMAMEEEAMLRRNEVGSSIAHKTAEVADFSSAQRSHGHKNILQPQQVRHYHSSPRYNSESLGVAPASLPLGWNVAIGNEESSSSRAAAEEVASLLDAKLQYLEELTQDQALSVLGKDANDRQSSPFLEEFYSLIPPTFPIAEHWAARMALIQYAINFNHPGYFVDDMIDVLHEAQLSAVHLKPEIFEFVIHSISESTKFPEAKSRYSDHMEPLNKILSIIEDMSLRKVPVFTPTTLESLTIAFEFARPHEIDSSEPQLLANSAYGLASILHAHRVSPPSISVPLNALDDLAYLQDWDAYWRYWSLLPMYLLRRPQILYTAMFTHIARTGHQRMCVKALTEWIPHIGLEQPSVRITADLSVAICECLRVADPEVEDQVMRGENQKGQWVKLWRLAEMGLEGEPEDTDSMQQAAEKLFAKAKLQPVSEI